MERSLYWYTFLHLGYAALMLAALIFYIYFHFRWTKAFYTQLESRHPDIWEKLGRPSSPNDYDSISQLFSTGFRTSGFLLLGKYRSLNDAKTTNLGNRLRILNLMALILSGIALLVELA